METQDINSIKQFIPTLILKLSDAKDKQKKIKEKIDDILDKNEEYSAFKLQEREIRVKKHMIEFALINNSDENKHLIDEKDECREEIKEMKIALSDYLGTIAQQTGSTQMELPSGEIIDIIGKYSVKPKQMRLFF